MSSSGKHRAERMSADQVHVQVEHHLAAMLVAIDDEAEAVLGDSFLLRDVARHDEHVAERALVVLAHVVDRGDGLVRHDEHVYRRLGADVAEGRDPVVHVHDGGRDLAGDDFFENGWHGGRIRGGDWSRRPGPPSRELDRPGGTKRWLPGGQLAHNCAHSRRRPLKLTLETLRSHLSGEPARAYLVSGDEALLVGEAADAIRARVKRAGFEEREVHFIERVADWEEVRASSNNLSLFGSRKLVELRLPSGKPGTGGAKAIADLLENPSPDNVYLMITGKLEREQNNSAWVKAFETAGAWLPVWPVEVSRLPQWLRARAAQMDVEMDDDAVRFIVDRTEGNLLAAYQELEKLKLSGGKRIDLAAAQASIADSARFDVF